MSETKIRVLGDRLLVKPSDREKMTKSGLHIPDSVEDKPVTGTVIHASIKSKFAKEVLVWANTHESSEGIKELIDIANKYLVDVNDGDNILFGGGAGSEIEVHDEKYIIMREADVVAVI